MREPWLEDVTIRKKDYAVSRHEVNMGMLEVEVLVRLLVVEVVGVVELVLEVLEVLEVMEVMEVMEVLEVLEVAVADVDVPVLVVSVLVVPVAVEDVEVVWPQLVRGKSTKVSLSSLVQQHRRGASHFPNPCSPRRWHLWRFLCWTSWWWRLWSTVWQRTKASKWLNVTVVPVLNINLIQPSAPSNASCHHILRTEMWWTSQVLTLQQWQHSDLICKNRERLLHSSTN